MLKIYGSMLCPDCVECCNALEKAQIPFVPLKGSVIRKYYPEAWMRTSSDIDVLVHKEDVEKTTDNSQQSSSGSGSNSDGGSSSGSSSGSGSSNIETTTEGKKIL